MWPLGLYMIMGRFSNISFHIYWNPFTRYRCWSSWTRDSKAVCDKHHLFLGPVRAWHGFVNPHGYPGMGGTGMGIVMIGFMCTWCVHIFLFLFFLFPFWYNGYMHDTRGLLVNDSWWLRCCTSPTHVWLMVAHRPSLVSINTCLFVSSFLLD